VPGKYQDERNSSACKLCAANHFANETEMTKCHVCAIGTVARDPGAAACQACIAGSYGASCSKCPPGRYRTGDDSDVTQCRECPAGFNQPENGTTYCLGCEAGQFADTSALPTCKRCPAGKVVPEKRTTDAADCQPCEITGTIPNDAQSECFQPVVNGLAGIPEERQRWTEGGTYAYNVRLNFQPSAPVTVVVESAAAAASEPAPLENTNPTPPSPPLPSPPAPAAACDIVAGGDLTFTADNWDQDQSIRVAVADDSAFLAKDSVSFTCLIAHHVASADGTASFASAMLTLDAVSTGCGAGEFVGAADRGENGTNCVCSTTFYLPPTSDCVKCPSPQASCDENGLLAPHMSPGFWRADPTSPDLDLHPFYACPQKLACTGGNSTETRCLEGHDTSSPLCAVCNDGFYLSGVRPMERCVVCPERKNTSSVSSALVAFVLVGFAIYMLGSAWFVSKPVITKKNKPLIKERLRRLSISMLRSGSNGSGDGSQQQQQQHHHQQQQQQQQQQLDLHSFKRALQDTSLTSSETTLLYEQLNPERKGSITHEEIARFLHEEHEEHENKTKSRINGTRATGNKKRQSLWKRGKAAAASTGVSNRDDISEQAGVIRERMQAPNHTGIELSSMGAPTLSVPSAGGFDVKLDISTGLFEMPAASFDVNLLDTPTGFVVPSAGSLELDMNLPPSPGGLNMNHFDVRNFDRPVLPTITVNPTLVVRGGGLLMKFKLVLGFVQVISFIPITFSLIPWPDEMLSLAHGLYMISVDVLSAFGNVCVLHVGFYPRFLFQMCFLPAMYLATWIVYVCVLRCSKRRCAKRAALFTAESVRTKAFELLFIMTYALYTSVSTTIFRLFKCQNVQGTWYLTADYRLRCFEGVWYLYASLAIAGIAAYTIGIPLVLFVVLRRNRRYLYESTCPRDQMHRHAKVKRQLGAVYADYNPDAYYFDLVDMLRRLLLTGGLIILGESSNTQIFLGALICMAWLCLVLAKRPYRAFWDNALSVASSSGLLLVILSGMALEIYRLTPAYAQDPYQRHAFGAIMMVASVFVIVSAAGIIFMSIPFVRDRVCAKCAERCGGKGGGKGGKGGKRGKREERERRERRGGREYKQEQTQWHEQSGMCAAGSGPGNEDLEASIISVQASAAGSAASAHHSHMEGAVDAIAKSVGAAASIASGTVFTGQNIAEAATKNVVTEAETKLKEVCIKVTSHQKSAREVEMAEKQEAVAAPSVDTNTALEAKMEPRVNKKMEMMHEKAIKQTEQTEEQTEEMEETEETEEMEETEETEETEEMEETKKKMEQAEQTKKQVEQAKKQVEQAEQAAKEAERKALELERLATRDAHRAVEAEAKAKELAGECNTLKKQVASLGAMREEEEEEAERKALELERFATRDAQRAVEAEAKVEVLKKQVASLGETGSEMEELRKTAAAAAVDARKRAEEAETTAMEMTRLYKEESLLRKLHWNTIEDMKGKIRVFCRSRPLSGSEVERGCQVCVDYPDKVTIGVTAPKGRKEFLFDQCFTKHATQGEVFADCAHLIQSAFDGFNVCVFAYGQTGSGKTFTMVGSPERPGLTPRAIGSIFEKKTALAGRSQVTISCYIAELYNDGMVDLLWKHEHGGKGKSAGDPGPPRLEIKKDAKGMVFIKGIVTKEIRSVDEAMHLFQLGNAARRVGVTRMNVASSRSHLVFAILVENKDLKTHKVSLGKLSLVDLAGSERVGKTGATKDRLKEAKSINKSLSALGDVISALSKGAQFVPYRNNKLTMLLSDGLGGNAKTLMFVNLSPADVSTVLLCAV
jgi:hypothetical protein